MKKALLILSQLLIINILFAQEKICFQSDFEKDDKSWTNSTWDDNIYYRKIKNGKYYMEHRSVSGSYVTHSFPYIEKNKNFSLEYEIIMTEGSVDSWINLQITESNGNIYIFEVSPVKKTTFISVINSRNEVKKLQNYSTAKAIKGLNEINKIKLWSKNNLFEFYINDILLFSSKDVTMNKEGYIKKVSLGSTGRSRFEVDNFIIWQDQNDINLSGNTIKYKSLHKMGPGVNSSYSERRPVISHDGQELYFIRLYHPQNTGTEKLDDIWISRIDSNGNESPAVNPGEPLNNVYHNGVISISADNQSIVVMGSYSNSGTDFFSSTKTANGWSPLQPIKIKDFNNLSIFKEASMSMDNSVFIFGMKTNDSYGENDLYVSFRLKDGTYSKPVNMGPDVNTWGWEVSPFLAADNKTLYFSSDGHKGYGSNDIFVSKRLDDTWTKWSKPVNLGSTINSPGWDVFFSTSASGEDAYLTSDVDGNADIYRIELEKEVRPDPVINFHGKVKRENQCTYQRENLYKRTTDR